MSEDRPPVANDDEASPLRIALHPKFGDGEQMLNMRDWLTRAAERAGATFEGGGCGMGEADIDVILEGHRYNIRIKPILRHPAGSDAEGRG